MADLASPAIVVLGAVLVLGSFGVAYLAYGYGAGPNTCHDYPIGCFAYAAFCGLPVFLLGLGLVIYGGARGQAIAVRALVPPRLGVQWTGPGGPVPPRYCERCGSKLVYELSGFGRCPACGEVRYPPAAYP